MFSISPKPAVYLPWKVARRWSSIDYLLKAVEKSKKNASVDVPTSSPLPAVNIVSPGRSKRKLLIRKQETSIKKQELPPRDIRSLIVTPSDLNDIFRHDIYPPMTKAQLTTTQSLFNRANVKLEWTLASFDEIPDVKYALLAQQRQSYLDLVSASQRTEYHDNLARSKKTFGYTADSINLLPEVLLLGHTNVGKSSLLNTLLLQKQDYITNSAGTQHARVSKRAGFTKTLNCFNVDNKLRILDLPGYGEYGDEVQGKAVVEYINRRRNLNRVFLLVDSVYGFREEDQQLVQHLMDVGVSFEIVFTKVDEVILKYMPKEIRKMPKKVENGSDRIRLANMVEAGNHQVVTYFQQIIEEANLQQLATLPRLLFNNSMSNNCCTQRNAFKEIRFAILQSCGLV